MMKKNILALISLILLVVLTTNVLGVGISPSFLYVDELIRGNTYEKNFKALNLDDSSQMVELKVTGDAADWVTFKDITTGEEITSIVVPAKSDIGFIFEYTIPDDAPNGVYEGYINLEAVGDKDAENPVKIVQRNIYRLTVSGNERIEGVVDSISTQNTESGQPLRIIYGFRNTGNVAATPVGEAAIYKDGEFIETVEIEGEYVKRGGFLNQEIVWDTENHGTGDFIARVVIMLDNNNIGEKELSFNLAPRGTFTVDALVGDVKKPSTWIVDEVGKTEVQFFNKGKIDVTAKVVAEVIKNGKVVDVVTGDDIFVSAGGTEDLYFYYKPTEVGEYELKTKVLFAGRESEVDPFSIDVMSGEDVVNAEGFEDSGSNTLVVVLIVLVAVLIVAIAVFGFWYFRG